MSALFVLFVYALLLAPAQRLAMKMGCVAPLPGPDFPMTRCTHDCSWCGYIAEFDQAEKTQGPYR